MSEAMFFRPRARLLLQLGDQLIRNEKVALLELIKNAYDADAKKVEIFMRNIDKPGMGSIIIKDNGIGMDQNILRNVWMEPGTDYKEKLIKEKIRTKLGRLPMGEKGIGRFGAHKLGLQVEVVSRMNGKKEVHLNIDWTSFEKAGYLSDIHIDVKERTPKVFTGNKTGTQITITKLRAAWTRGMVRDAYRAITSLNSPFESLESFDIVFDIDKEEWLKDLATFEDIKNKALFKVSAVIESNMVKTFAYEFAPWSTMKRISSKTEEQLGIKMVDADSKTIDISKFNIGQLKVDLYIYDRDSFVLSLWEKDRKTLKDYLDDNGGIRVYRDNLRVLDYGEAGNDWLNLGARRINVPSKRISNNLVIGAIRIDRETSSDLKEKANREGFIENEAYFEFKKAVLFVFELSETYRNIDKDRLRMLYKQTSSQAEPIVDNLIELKDKINESKIEENIKQEFNVYIKRIEDDYKYISEVYLRSASVGLNLSVVIHEVEKIIYELNKVVEKEKPNPRIVKLAKHLAELVEGYSSIIRDNDEAKVSVVKIIEQALFNIEYRLQAHKIELIDAFAEFDKNYKLKCSKNLVISTIVNLIDNSIWWTNYADRKEKKIFVDISNDMPGYVSIVIADNGTGFTLPTDDIVKPFVTRKPGGMGIGLYLANEIMKTHSGKLIFPEKGDFDIPNEFENGAIVALAFKEEK